MFYKREKQEEERRESQSERKVESGMGRKAEERGEDPKKKKAEKWCGARQPAPPSQYPVCVSFLLLHWEWDPRHPLLLHFTITTATAAAATTTTSTLLSLSISLRQPNLQKNEMTSQKPNLQLWLRRQTRYAASLLT